MELTEYLDVPYRRSGGAYDRFDVYAPRTEQHLHGSALICFIHGGAWRTGDKSDHADLGRSLAISTGHPVAIPNYRLTPKHPTPDNALYHPAHAADTLQFLEFVRLWHKENGGHLSQTPSRLFLIGHSCSAHMLCTIFLHMPGDLNGLCPSEELIQSTAGIIMSEGIYDIDLLLSSFSQYRNWFIENTFGTRDTFEDVSVFNATSRPNGQHIRWFIIHSKGDTLVDERQSEAVYSFLKRISCPAFESFDELKDEHNAILQCPQYIGIIDRFISGFGSTGTD